MVPSEDRIFEVLKRKVEADLEDGMTLDSSLCELFRVYKYFWLQVRKDERPLLKERYQNAVKKHKEYVDMLRLIGALHDNK